jgi:hypothetical protein
MIDRLIFLLDDIAVFHYELIRVDWDARESKPTQLGLECGKIEWLCLALTFGLHHFRRLT